MKDYWNLFNKFSYSNTSFLLNYKQTLFKEKLCPKYMLLSKLLNVYIIFFLNIYYLINIINLF